MVIHPQTHTTQLSLSLPWLHIHKHTTQLSLSLLYYTLLCSTCPLSSIVHLYSKFVPLVGRRFLQQLVRSGIKCSYVLINAVSYIMKEVGVANIQWVGVANIQPLGVTEHFGTGLEGCLKQCANSYNYCTWPGLHVLHLDCSYMGQQHPAVHVTHGLIDHLHYLTMLQCTLIIATCNIIVYRYPR